MLRPKQSGTKRKLYKFHQFINDFIYYDFRRAQIGIFKGWMYALEKPSREVLYGVLKEYDNTKVIGAYYSYAPEQKRTWLFIAD